MIAYPGFNPIAFEIGPVKVHWYGIMYLVGFAGAWWLGRFRAKRPQSTWTPEEVDDLIFFAMLGVIVGGRVGYVLFYGLGFWADDPFYPLKIWAGGMSFHGGMLGVLIAFSLYAWRRGRRIWDVFDFAAPLPGIGLLAGRLGNFINGELWGKPTSLPWGMVFQSAPDRLPRHPSQLYEAALEGLVLLAILWGFGRRPRPPAASSGLFLLGYGVFRFLIEFVRVPDAQLGYLHFGWMTRGQELCLPMIAFGLLFLWMAYSGKTPGKTAETRDDAPVS